MNILEQIVAAKKLEVQEQKNLYPIKLLERSIYFESPVVSLKNYVTRSDKSGVIAEIKRRSPSKSVINGYISVEKISIGYMQAGASALSVLTDKTFFGGSSNDLQVARKFNYCPILRKEFIIDEYQIIEAKSLGADAVLLIAAILNPGKMKRFAELAQSLGMEVLLEVHREEEIETIAIEADVIGINNRNLMSFETSIENSIKLSAMLPKETIRISESGIDSAETAFMLKQEGFHGFLIGEQFMRHSRPEDACAAFIKQLNKLKDEDQSLRKYEPGESGIRAATVA
jgi:indole-3-glycerol phosphate synthase